jgi:hypothetical protein
MPPRAGFDGSDVGAKVPSFSKVALKGWNTDSLFSAKKSRRPIGQTERDNDVQDF